MHPSYVANYQRQNCHKARQDICRDIQEACSQILHTSSARHAVPRHMNIIRISTPTIQPEANSADVMVIQQFLDHLVEHCIPEPELRPSLCIRVSKDKSRSYFTFLAKQKRYLANLCKARRSISHDAQDYTRCLLIPILMRLNCTLKRTSYFSATYEADWDSVSEILSDPTLDLEGLCWEAGMCPSGTSKEVLRLAILFDELPFAGVRTQKIKAIERLARLNSQHSAMESKRCSTTPPRQNLLTGNGDLFLFEGNRALTKAFKLALVTSHDCRTCFWESRHQNCNGNQ